MRTEAQQLTDMLGQFSEDRYFARRAQEERRALRSLERSLQAEGTGYSVGDKARSSLLVRLAWFIGFAALAIGLWLLRRVIWG